MADGGLIAARLLSYGALLLVAGVPIYLVVAGGGPAITRRLRMVLALLAVIGAIASVWWALAGVASMAGIPLSDLDSATAWAVLEATPLGRVLAVRLILLLLVIVATLVPWPAARLPLAALCGGAALATAAWTGHAGATEGTSGTVHRLADIAHLIAAAAWLGALAVLLRAATSDPSGGEFDRRLRGFARIGSVIVLTLLLTGVVNTLAIAGFRFDPALLTSQWGVLLAIKLALFAGMLALAGINRWRLVPALAAGTYGVARHLRTSLAIESTAGVAIVGIVAVLGTLDPAA